MLYNVYLFDRWICVYPAYINSKKTVKEGRRIPKEKVTTEDVQPCSHSTGHTASLSMEMIVFFNTDFAMIRADDQLQSKD